MSVDSLTVKLSSQSYDTDVSWGENLGVDLVPHASRRV